MVGHLVAETEGHQAPVWGLIWSDPTSLISAGEDKVVKVWDVRERRLVRSIRDAATRQGQDRRG